MGRGEQTPRRERMDAMMPDVVGVSQGILIACYTSMRLHLSAQRKLREKMEDSVRW